jgi:hypothetical protein
MKLRNATNRLAGPSTICALLLGLLTPVPAAAQTPPPVATPPYTVSVFAQNPQGVSQPDSIVLWHDHVIVGFSNGVAKDGTDGKSSTIVEFALDGTVKRTFSVPGHNDGLRVVDDDDVWSLQNEDANPNLVVIELSTGKSKLYKFPPTPHGGGYDDIVVKSGNVFLSASNPMNLNAQGVNTFPALVRATLAGDHVVLDPVLNGNAEVTDVATGKPVTLNLLDPDSMSVDPRGNIVLDSQADSELIFIRHPFTKQQTVGRLALSSSVTGPMNATITVDDTAFAPRSKCFLLLTDVSGGLIYRIDSPTFGFEPGTAYSTSDTLGLLGTLNLDNGFITPIVTGFGSARGLLFVAADGDNDGDDK